MIVEDNASMRRLIKSLIGDLFESVCECSDGDEALDAYSQALPDWVLIDIKMRRVDGLTACRQIKAAHPAACICIVTQYSDERTKEAAFKAGACAYVLKEEFHILRSVLAAGC